MEPFSPQDPLSKLLNKARPVEPRANFTANVMRAIRQAPQRESLWTRLTESWLRPQPVFALGAVAVAASMVALWTVHPWSGNGVRVDGSPVADAGRPGMVSKAVPNENEVAAEWDGMNQLGALLAQRDPDTLSDSDMAALLY